jgi:hypothetical protein
MASQEQGVSEDIKEGETGQGPTSRGVTSSLAKGGGDEGQKDSHRCPYNVTS